MTDTMTPQLDRQKAFDDWFEALRSGNYTQGIGALCKEDEDGNKEHCCIGVLDEVVFETTWEPAFEAGDGKTIMIDKFGEEGNLDVAIVAPLGLDQHVTTSEVDRLLDYHIAVDVEDTRIAVLATLNDSGVDYDTLVMLMEEFGWKND